MYHLPLIVFKIDLRKAFDSLKHSVVALILDDAIGRGLNPIIAHALLVEVCTRGATANFPGCESDAFLMLKGFGQGPNETPALFTAALDFLLAEAVQRWRKRGWGWVGVGVEKRGFLTLADLKFNKKFILSLKNV